MESINSKPWTSGPRELLEHAIDHVHKDSAFDNRIAFISIDNTIEIMIKTYLGLPKRIRHCDGPSRKKLSDASHSFPALLDLFEEFGSGKLEGIELGDIDWYHRIRNTLYHDGNGITVDKQQVDSYLQISVILFNSLFDTEFTIETPLEPNSVLGEIVLNSAKLEHSLNLLFQKNFPEFEGRLMLTKNPVYVLCHHGIISEELMEDILESRKIRNEAVHSTGDIELDKVKSASKSMVRSLSKINDLI